MKNEFNTVVINRVLYFKMGTFLLKVKKLDMLEKVCVSEGQIENEQKAEDERERRKEAEIIGQTQGRLLHRVK